MASIKPQAGKVVWGVVYEIALDDEASLDCSEGYKPHSPEKGAYRREEKDVVLVGQSTRTRVNTYIANPQDGEHLPSRDYKRLIVNGALHWGLPPDYLRVLCDLQTME